MPIIMPLPLFDVYPDLSKLLTSVELSQLPTPVACLADCSEDESLKARYQNAWIKQDDKTHHEYGGNKIRKLDFILADIQQQGKKHVFTFGAIGTNAGVATAMACRDRGLKCTIFLFDQPESDTVRKNYRAMQKYGAELIHCGSLLKTVLRFYLCTARLSQDSYFLWAGCSNPVATLAYVNATFELKQQIEQGLLPEPSKIYLPVGSTSTVAGLTLGVQLAGLKSQVVGVRVVQQKLGWFDSCTESMADDYITQAAELLGVAKEQRPNCKFDHSYFGEAYGQPTQQSQTAVNEFSKLGISLENTYSGKAAAAFLDQLDASKNEPVLFWNTFSSV